MAKVHSFPKRFTPKVPSRRFEFEKRSVDPSDYQLNADLFDYEFAFIAYENAGEVVIRVKAKRTGATRDFIPRIEPLPGWSSPGISVGLRAAIIRVNKLAHQEMVVETDFGDEPLVERCLAAIDEWRDSIRGQAHPMKADEWLRTAKPELYNRGPGRLWWQKARERTSFQMLSADQQAELLGDKWGISYSKSSRDRACAGGADPKSLDELEELAKAKTPGKYREYLATKEARALKKH